MHLPSIPSRRTGSGRPASSARFLLAAVLLLPAPARPAAAASPPPSVLLVTLDTTRADALGAYGAAPGATPTLDRLAAGGTRWARAISPAPLTLPSHATLLTGLYPPEHGLRENGVGSLPRDLPTLATRLSARGYASAAFVASLVLDRRFGLDRGFTHYDDTMAAERLGEYGYPERDAREVTDAALRWLGAAPAGPVFLWVHYYDPHSPYQAPGQPPESEPRLAYAAEVAHVDRELGRLFAALPSRPAGWLVAVVGDHGEALGEHGERGHGIFLYRASLEVPLLLQGPGVPAGATVTETVSIRRLASTLLALTGARPTAGESLPGPSLPGLPGLAAGPPEVAYSESRMPASAYGWSPLTALTDQRYRLVRAPRPELYDVTADAGETTNLVDSHRREARRLERRLAEIDASFKLRQPGEVDDPELAAALRSLGYLSGASREEANGLDPKDGVPMLARLDEAKDLLHRGQPRAAATLLAELVAKNPGNVPFLTQLAGAHLAAGDGEAAIAAYRQAAAINPRLHFLHQNLGDAYRQLGQGEAAKREYELAVELHPRAAGAWLALAEMANRSGDAAAERGVLERAVAAGTASGLLLARLAQVEMQAGEIAAAERHLAQATDLLPGWPTAWLVRGQLELGRSRPDAARPHLERALALGPDTPEGREARRLLARIRPR